MSARSSSSFRLVERTTNAQKVLFYLDVVLSETEHPTEDYSIKMPPQKPIKRDEANLSLTLSSMGLARRQVVYVSDSNA